MSTTVVDGVHLAIDHASTAGEARRAAVSLATTLGFDEPTTGKAALIATELATNLARHARQGELAIRVIRDGTGSGLEILALDHGPGISDVSRALSDGFSTGGSAGTGLGAVRRLASRFEIFSARERGTVVFAELWPRAWARERFEIGAICVPHPHEVACGDAWAAERAEGSVSIALVDGLGHGLDAAIAAAEAVRLFRSGTGPPAERLRRMHEGLGHTRGAAAAVWTIDAAARLVRWASVGNVRATIRSGGLERHLAGHDGTAGQNVRKIEERDYPWPEDATLIAKTDGIGRAEIERYPGILARHPAVIAAVVYLDAKRPRDDATVVVVKDARP